MKAVSLAAELKIMMATTFVKIGKQVYYVFDDYAVSKIKAHFSSFPDKKRTGTKVKTPVSEQEARRGMPTVQ